MRKLFSLLEFFAFILGPSSSRAFSAILYSLRSAKTTRVRRHLPSHRNSLETSPPSPSLSSSSIDMISAAGPSPRLRPPPIAGSPAARFPTICIICAASISCKNQSSRKGRLPSRNGGSALRPVLLPPPEKKGGAAERERRQMWVLCGFGYWVQGFRCFPWLALNFHLIHGLGLGPSALQLVQNTANLPMVAKPLYGIISDAIPIGGAHRLPYISLGVFMQVVSWVFLALIPISRDLFPAQMACILLGNIGASFTEVVGDALVAEFSRENDTGFLQSCSFMALAAGGIMGNLSGGFAMAITRRPDLIFLSFSLLLSVQLALALTSRESQVNPRRRHGSADSKLSSLVSALTDEKIRLPLSWIVGSIAVVPLLSGSIFCFQIQSLKLDPLVIGLSRVFGQMIVLSAAFFYNHRLKNIPLRKLMFWVQLFYAISLLSDLILVRQMNIKMGISNEAYVLCASAIAEAVAQFRILPFSVLLAGLCPAGCEGSVFAFFGSALCLSSIVSGVFGVGLAALVGAGGGDSDALCAAIVLQFMAALVPLAWISRLPMLPTR